MPHLQLEGCKVRTLPSPRSIPFGVRVAFVYSPWSILVVSVDLHTERVINFVLENVISK